MRLFVDMDGVLADFAQGYEYRFGVRPDRGGADDVDWAAVRATPGFYRYLPPMPDMRELWDYVAPFRPILLTGVPSDVPDAATDKCDWVRHYLGFHVEVRCCKARDKALQAQPGDILIDDWPKYRTLWLERGGIWITHTSAAATIATLRGLRQAVVA